jgi:hypothetical protein
MLKNIFAQQCNELRRLNTVRFLSFFTPTQPLEMQGFQQQLGAGYCGLCIKEYRENNINASGYFVLSFSCFCQHY